MLEFHNFIRICQLDYFKININHSHFLNNVFKNNHIYYADDNNQDYGLVNQLMINQFAEQLVDTDFLDLSHITIDE